MAGRFNLRTWFNSLETIGMPRFKIPEEFPRKLCKKLMRQSHPSQCSDEECIAQLNDEFVSIGSACNYIKDHLDVAKPAYFAALNRAKSKKFPFTDLKFTEENMEMFGQLFHDIGVDDF